MLDKDTLQDRSIWYVLPPNKHGLTIHVIPLSIELQPEITFDCPLIVKMEQANNKPDLRYKLSLQSPALIK
jgi:hypothetical protein